MNTMRKPLRVVICDDHRTMREALAGYLATQPGIAVAHTAATADEALRLVRQDADVLVLDLRLADENGLELLEAMQNLGMSVPVLVLGTQNDFELVAHALALGALGYLPKTASPQMLYEAVLAVFNGRAVIPDVALGELLHEIRSQMRAIEESRAQLARLTARERDVLRLLSNGMDRVEIARRLEISGNTVRTHIRQLLMKLGVNSQLAAAARGREMFRIAGRRVAADHWPGMHVIDLRDETVAARRNH